MAGEESDVRKKHHRSPEDGVDEGSKRRKHSHHRHHHRHRSSKRDRRHEGDDVSVPSSPPPVSSVVPCSNSRREEDKEEGEILEEEDCVAANGDLMKKKLDSDIESGEIKSEEVFGRSDQLNLVIRDDGDTFSGDVIEVTKLNIPVPSQENDVVPNSSNDVVPNDVVPNSSEAVRNISNYGIHECSDRKDVKMMDNEVDESKDTKIKLLLSSGKVSEIGEIDESGARLESFQFSEKKREKRHGGSSHRDRTPSLVNGDTSHRSRKRDPRTENGSVSPNKGTQVKKDDENIERVVSGRHDRSRSPLHKEVDECRRHRKSDDHGVKTDKYRDGEEMDSVRYMARRDLEGAVDRNLGSENKSLAPEVIDNKHTTVMHSPSIDRYHEEAHLRNRSRSREPVRERRSQSRSYFQDEKVYHVELDVKSYRDNTDRVKPSGSGEKARYESDLEGAVRHGREEKFGSRDWTKDRDREHSSSYSRNGGREERHASRDTRDRDNERGRERERSSSYSRRGGREERHGSRDIRERERHGSRDIRERERHGSRDIRERERHGSRDIREREKEREREIERDGERNRAKDKEREMDRRRDKYDDRDRRDRNQVRERERVREKGLEGYKDSRRPKQDEPEPNRRRTRNQGQDRASRFRNEELELGGEKLKRDEDEQEDYEEKVELKLAAQEEEDIDRIKEESRKRRQAILEKHRQRQSQKQVDSHSEDPSKDEKDPSTVGKLKEKPCPPKAATNSALEGFKNDGLDVYDAEPLFSVGKSPQQNGPSTFERTPGAVGLGEGTPKSERSEDMFCDDIFGESPAGVRKTGKGDGLQIERSGLNDNWDDAEGYYSYRFGEVLDGRYEVVAAHGKGVFSTVVRAKDLKAGNGEPEEVAIKIIRSNDTMYKAGLEELIILKKLAGADPEDRRHCVRFISSFKYRNHLCLVFESLHMNLREVLKKFGRNIGLKLTAVRAYAKQLFIALKHLRNCGVLHCDIKPDNMLVNEAKNVLKLCDFGNAMFAGKNEITPYLVSRFYRAPEIILGLAYDHPMDIWSVGCCLYELYSGKVIFPGPSNNDMLRLHMELKGPFPKKMLRKGAFTDQHFDHDMNFYATEEDPVTKKAAKRLLLNIKPKDISTIITGSSGEDPKMLTTFKDLLEKIFILDPEKRITVSQALSHPFITGK